MIEIYILVDPRDSTPRYVGQSTDSEIRLKQHINQREHEFTEKAKWIRDLVRLGMKPRTQVLETCENCFAADLAEKRWIKYFIERNVPLFNLAAGGRSWGTARSVNATPDKWIALANGIKNARNNFSDLTKQMYELLPVKYADRLMRLIRQIDSWKFDVMEEFCKQLPNLAEHSGKIFQGDGFVTASDFDLGTADAIKLAKEPA